MSLPFFLNCVDIENALGLAVLHDLGGRSPYREVHTEANLIHEDAIENLFEVVMSQSNLDEFHGFRDFWKLNRMGVDDCDFIKFEVPLDERQCSLAYGAVPDDADVVNVPVDSLCFHKKLNSL